MANLDLLLPGMASLMEGDVEITNNVTIPEEAEIEHAVEETEAVDEATEGAEVGAEIEQTAEAAEMISRQFDELLAMRDHVAKFGVDRSFLSLCNRGDILGRALGVALPACESFDAVGSPTSAVSVACMEAFSDKVRGIWERVKEFVKNLCKKVRDLFARFGEWVASFFKKGSDRIAQLIKARKGRVAKKLEAGEKFDVIVPIATADFLKDFGVTEKHLAAFNKACADLVVDSANTAKKVNVKQVVTDLAGFVKTIDEHTLKNASTLATNVQKGLDKLTQKIDTPEQAAAYLDQIEKIAPSFKATEAFYGKLDKGIEAAVAAAEKAVANFKGKDGDDKANEAALANLKDMATATSRVGSMIKAVVAANIRSANALIGGYAKVLFKTTAVAK